ncbi:hypothetical protein GCM10010350_34330 [Streptomyces galilaeus]|nr:hypothetical protein GCM10010350_34330 [Streptomyces galilaeus]
MDVGRWVLRHTGCVVPGAAGRTASRARRGAGRQAAAGSCSSHGVLSSYGGLWSYGVLYRRSLPTLFG